MEKETIQNQLEDEEIDTNEQYQENGEIPDMDKEMMWQEQVNDDNSLPIRDEKNEKRNETQ